MMVDADRLRAEQQRQTDELAGEIMAVLKRHSQREREPMLGAAIAALAANLGQSLGHIGAGSARKSAREQAMKIVRASEREACDNPRGTVTEVVVNKRH